MWVESCGLFTVGCDKEELVTCIECHIMLMQMYDDKERDKGNPPPKVAIRQLKTAVLVPDPEWFQVDDRGNYTLKAPLH
jgi:hypothetical protein